MKILKNFKLLVFFLGFLIFSASAVYAFTGPGSQNPGTGSGAISVDADGVGVGTDNPAYDLDVAGNINFTGTLYNSGVEFSGGGSGAWSESGSDIYYNDGNVGIGINSPDGTLHVRSGASGALSPHLNFDDLVVENSGHTGITISTPSTHVGSLVFADSGSNLAGRIRYRHTDDDMTFFTTATERVKIDSSGRVGIGVEPSSSWFLSGDTGSSRFYLGNTSGAGAFFGGTNAGSYLLAAYNDSTSNYDFRVNPGGYVGVGSSPNSSYSIWVPGNTAYGIRAFGTTMGGRFEDSNGSGRGYVGYGGWDFYGNGSGNSYFTGSVRAPIFYDSDNTSFWMNPSATETSMNLQGGIDFAANSSLMRNGDRKARLVSEGFRVYGEMFRAQSNAWIFGDLDVDGSKNFRTPHPLKEDKDLYHAAIEGPESAVFYRGEANLNNGKATIELPEYFEALVRDEDRTVQLTPKGKTPFLLSYTDIEDGKFNVYSNKNKGEFSWEVKAVRADIERLEVERDKRVIDD